MHPLRLCLIGKYPPIQGGVSASNYWFARSIADRGHKVEVVTNAPETEPAYRVFVPDGEADQLEYASRKGGYVRLWTTAAEHSGQYIPYANPFVSKLASLAASVIKEYGCDAVLSTYLEPYGVAGNLAAHWADVPHAVKHAGSDISRLTQLPHRLQGYLEVMRCADLVVSGPPVAQQLVALGVPANALLSSFPKFRPKIFTPNGPVLPVEQIASEARDAGFSPASWPREPFHAHKPTIGFYGKPGRYKGTSQLVRSLAILRRAGHDFNVLALVGHAGRRVEDLIATIEHHDLTDSAYVLPFLPPWMVPQFLRACSMVCALEHRFPVAVHTPGLAQEVLTTGRLLIASQEIYGKIHRPVRPARGSGCLVVEDPDDEHELSRVLEQALSDPSAVESIAATGHSGAPTASLPSVFDDFMREMGLIALVHKETTVGLRELQEASLRIYTDPAFRREVRNARGEHGRPALSVNESLMLSELAGMEEKVASFGRGLLRKRFMILWRQFDGVRAFFPASEEPLFRSFSEEFDFAQRGIAEEIAWFAEFLIASAESVVAKVPVWFADLVRHDALRVQVELAAGPEPEGVKLGGEARKAFGWEGDELPDAVRTSGGIRIESFAFDLATARSETEQPDFRRGPSEIAFVPRGGMRAAVFRLTPALSMVLTLAGSGITVSALVSGTVGEVNDDKKRQGLEVACRAGITSLLSAGLLEPAQLS